MTFLFIGAVTVVPTLLLLWYVFKSLRDEQERLFHVLEHRERVLGSELAPEFEWASDQQRERTWWAWTKRP